MKGSTDEGLLISRLNRGRSAHVGGCYREAAEIFAEVVETLTRDVTILDGSYTASLLDAGVRYALSLLELGQRVEARARLEDAIRAVGSATVDVDLLLSLFRDAEQRRSFTFAQLKLVEMALDELDPPPRVARFLRVLQPWIGHCRLPLIQQHALFVAARLRRAAGQWRRAVDMWRSGAAVTARLIAQGDATGGGFPPRRWLCEAALTLEARGDRDQELGDLLRVIADGVLTRWEEAILQGMQVRRRAWIVRKPPDPSGNDDTELHRTRFDAWFCSLERPSDADAESFLRALSSASLGARLCYTLRAIRWQRICGVKSPASLIETFGRQLMTLSPDLREDYGISAEVDSCLDAANGSLVRILCI